MQSLCNVIKRGSVISNGQEKIETSYEIKSKEKKIEEKNIENYIDSYENLAKSILENARKKAEEFLAKAYEEAETVEEQAFKKGYSEGHEKGEKAGYEDAYEAYIEKGKAAYEEMIHKSNELLLNSEGQYQNYLREKEKEVRELVFTIVESVLKHEVKDKDAMNDIIYNNLEKLKKSTSFVVKCNDNYYEEINSKLEFWKNQLPYKGEIFIINDVYLEDGQVSIETEKGKVISSIDIALDKIKEVLINEK